EGSLISVGTPAASGAQGAGTSAGTLRNGLFGLARTDQLRIQVQVPQAMSTAIAEGQPAAVTVREFPHREFNGKVFRIAGGLDPTSRTRQVEVRLSNPGNTLVPGMYADVRLTAAGAPRSLRIPAGA